MKAAKTQKKLKEMPYPPEKKAFKEKKIVLHHQRQMAQFHKLLQKAQN